MRQAQTLASFNLATGTLLLFLLLFFLDLITSRLVSNNVMNAILVFSLIAGVLPLYKLS